MYLRLHFLIYMDPLSPGTDLVRGGKDVLGSLDAFSKTRS